MPHTQQTKQSSSAGQDETSAAKQRQSSMITNHKADTGRIKAPGHNLACNNSVTVLSRRSYNPAASGCTPVLNPPAAKATTAALIVKIIVQGTHN